MYDDLRKLLSSGEIGEPQFVSASFGMAVMHQNVERLIKKEVAGKYWNNKSSTCTLQNGKADNDKHFSVIVSSL